MDQKTIIKALKRALDNGEGDLDDLENLLNRAHADIATVRAEEQKRKQQQEDARVAAITDLANRLLDNKTTSADVALVYNGYLTAQGKKATMTADSIEAGCKFANDLAAILDQVGVTLDNIFNDTKEPTVKQSELAVADNECEKTSNDADEIIARFLKTLNNK